MWGRRIQNGLIGVGVLLLAVWAVARLHAFLGSRSDRRTFEESKASALRAAPAPSSTAPSGAAAHRLVEGPVDVSLWSEKRVHEWKQSLVTDRRTPLAILRIPRLSIDVPVLEGTDDLTLNRGAGWIEGTARPGEPGNVALSAHRDGFFRALKDVAVGDELFLESMRETTRYVVAWTKIVTPDDVSVLDPTGGAAVTLVTCYPFYFIGSAPQRLIVRALAAPGDSPGEAGRPSLPEPRRRAPGSRLGFP